MKNFTRLLAIIALTAVIGFTMMGCADGKGGGGEPDLPGTIVISGPVGKTTFTVGDTLTATYTTTGTETVSYQWKRNVSNVGTNTTTYIPDQAGSYTVTVSANGFKSKTSTAITVNEGKTLVSITAEYTPATAIFPDTTLDTLKEGEDLTVTAKYSDNSTAEVTDYTLSVADDELIVGENTVTVNYTEGGVTKTTTFKVTVDELDHEHNWQLKEEKTAPTCTEEGEGLYECTLGAKGAHTDDLPIAALGHDWNTTFTILPATETTDSIKVITCKNDPSHTKDETAMNSSETGFEYATGTAGLVFTAIGSPATAYRVARGTASGAIAIPAYHRLDADSDYLPVQIPNSTTTSAFGGTSSNDQNTTVTSITFTEGASLGTIGSGAFQFCTNLTSVTIPASVTSIGMAAFQYCTNLTSVTIPASVTSIGNGAFGGCTGLTRVTFAGTIGNNLLGYPLFPGDLRDKYLDGGIGTYTRSGSGTTDAPYVWTKL